MANIILAQTDSVAGCGTLVGCSGGALAMVPQAREATKDGTPGSGELDVTILRLATQAGVMFQSANNEPGKTTWEAGDWVIRLNLTTVQETVTWEDTYVCRFDNACGSLAVVGSLTGQAISLGTAGVKQMTVAGAEQSANLSDEIYIVLLFANTSPHVDKVFGFIPDQNIDTPIVDVAGEDIVKVIDETLQFNEETLRPRVMFRIKNETEQLNEGTLRPRVMFRIKNETEQLNEGIIRRKSMVRMIAETLQINEGIVKVLGMVKVIGETLQINEGIGKVLGFVRVINETLQIDESIGKIKGFIKVIDESVNIQESVVRVRKLVRLIAETLQLNEGIVTFRKMLRVVDETLQISENILRVRKLVRIVVENVSIFENTLHNLDMVRVVNEAVSVVENIVKKLRAGEALVKVINETVQVSESVLKILAFPIVKVINEIVQISESISFKKFLVKSYARLEKKFEFKARLDMLFKFIGRIKRK